MVENPLRGKALAVGTILLFIVIAFSPTINARNDTIFPNVVTKKDVSITVMEYKPDGTIGKSVVKMSQEQADKFHEEMTNAQDLDTRLSIYKKYNLIPQNVTEDTLQSGMQEKAQRMGLTQDKLERMAKNNRTLFNKHLYVNIFCIVYGSGDSAVYGTYFLIPFGTSLFTFFINGHSDPKLISFDVLDYIIGSLYFESIGPLGWVQNGFYGLIKMIGFVGFMYHYWGHNMAFVEGFAGCAVYVRAIGTFS